jgi:hypothetical protein
MGVGKQEVEKRMAERSRKDLEFIRDMKKNSIKLAA